jgi:hypothetical protein
MFFYKGELLFLPSQQAPVQIIDLVEAFLDQLFAGFLGPGSLLAVNQYGAVLVRFEFMELFFEPAYRNVERPFNVPLGEFVGFAHVNGDDSIQIEKFDRTGWRCGFIFAGEGVEHVLDQQHRHDESTATQHPVVAYELYSPFNIHAVAFGV